MIRQRWSVSRALGMVPMVLVWMAAGIGAYVYIGTQRSDLRHVGKAPSQASAAQSGPLGQLPGTLYVVQEGTLYSLHQGKFTPILRAPADGMGWTQPALMPDGRRLVLVRRAYAYSDLYLVDTAGNVLGQLTHDASDVVELNHWAFYPRPSPDGGTLFFSYDYKDPSNYYNVVLAVRSMSMPGVADQSQEWSSPERFTGGDIEPIPLPSGGVLYTKYSFDARLGRILGEIYLIPGVGKTGAALTPLEDDCSQPSLSSDGRRLAMICTHASAFSSIQIAAFDGTSLSQRQTVVADQLVAEPTWAPDGSSLVYLAPQGVSGLWQLWQVPVPAAPSATLTPFAATPIPPGAPRGAVVQLTRNLDFDASSTIAWRA